LENKSLGFAIINFGEQGVRARDFYGNYTLEFMLVRDGSHTSAPEGGFPFTDLSYHELRFRIVPYNSSWRDAKIWVKAYDYNFPLVAKFVSNGYSKLPSELSLISSSGGEIVDLIPLNSKLNEFLIITSNYNSSLTINFNFLTPRLVYSSLIDGRLINEIKLTNNSLVAKNIKSLESFVIMLGEQR